MSKMTDYRAREERCRTLADLYANPETKASLSAAAECWKYLRELEEEPHRQARKAANPPRL